MNRTCTKCSTPKELNADNFYRNKGNSGGFLPRCKECCKAESLMFRIANREVVNAKERTRRQNDPAYRARQNAHARNWWKERKADGSDREIARRYNLRKYGLTVDQYVKLLSDQNGVCAICGKPELRGIELAVDHCHSTNKNRGLLCGNCNLGIGYFQDSPAILQLAINYLSKYGG